MLVAILFYLCIDIKILLLTNVLVVLDFNADYCLALVNQQEGEAEPYRLIYRFMFVLTFEFVLVYLIAWSCVFVANSGVSVLLHFLLHIILIARVTL